MCGSASESSVGPPLLEVKLSPVVVEPLEDNPLLGIHAALSQFPSLSHWMHEGSLPKNAVTFTADGEGAK